MSGTELTPQPEKVLADVEDLNRWMAQSFEEGRRHGKAYPRDKKPPTVTVRWLLTDPGNSAISPQLKIDR